MIELLLLLSQGLPGESPFSPVEPSKTFGRCITNLDDVDGDGVSDFLVSDPGMSGVRNKFRARGERGRVWLLSGASCEVIWTVASEHLDDGFGASVDVAGDLDSDGFQDWIVGSNDHRPGEGGYAAVHSGLTGSRLLLLEGRAGDGAFGYRVRGLGDVDGDGTPDLGVGSPEYGHESERIGRFICFSGDDGAEILTIEGSKAGAQLGRDFSSPGDLNGDGCVDLVIAETWSGHLVPPRLVSGKDGATLWIAPPSHCDTLESGMDSDGDGIQDIVMGCHDQLTVISGKDGTLLAEREEPVYGDPQFYPGFNSTTGPCLLVPDHSWGLNWGKVDVVSARTLETVYSVHAEKGVDTWHFGAAVCPLGDVDRDGVADFAVSSDHSTSGGVANVWVFSGKSGTCALKLERDDDGVALSRPSDAELIAQEPSELADFEDQVIDPHLMPATVVRRTAEQVEQAKSDGRRINPSQSTFGLGYSLVAIPSDGGSAELHPRCVFGLPDDERGSIWFLMESGVDPASHSPPPELGECSRYGAFLRLMPDLDEDGVSELIVSAPGGVDNPGMVFVVSLMTREVLFAVSSPGPTMSFGEAVCPVPDQDGDGVEDLAIYIRERDRESVGRTKGSVWVFSAVSGKRIRDPIAGIGGSASGRVQLEWIPLNRDGVAGLLVFSPLSKDQEYLIAVDVRTGDRAWVLEGKGPDGSLAWSVSKFPDVDGDGVLDLLVGDMGYWAGSDSARVRLVSSRTGVVLRSTTGTWISRRSGMTLAAYPDENRDGIDEILLPADNKLFGASLFVISGRDGTALRRFNIGDGFYRIGHAMSVGADWDGKGQRDICFSSYVPTAAGNFTHAIGVLSMEDGTLLHHVGPLEMQKLIESRDGSR